MYRIKELENHNSLFLHDFETALGNICSTANVSLFEARKSSSEEKTLWDPCLISLWPFCQNT